MKNIFFILLLFTNFLTAQQNFSSLSLNSLIDTIISHNLLHSHYTGLIDTTSKSYQLHLALKNKTTAKDLFTLNEHHNPTIRCYAYRLICDLNIEKTNEAFIWHVYDNSTILLEQGNRVIEEKVPQFTRKCANLLTTEYLDLSIESLIQTIAETNVLYGQYTGIGGRPTDIYKMYVALSLKASSDQLHTLVQHENAVVRCYAFWALCDRQEEGLFPILINHYDDTTTVKRHQGCVVSKISIGDFYIELLASNYISNGDYHRRNYSNITKQEKRTLDSLVLHNGYHLNYLPKMLLRHSSHPSDYEMIRQLVVEKKYFPALPALARYQKEKDVALILSFENYESDEYYRISEISALLKAIEAFPHKRFQNIIRNSPDLQFFEREYLYDAIAAYQDTFSIEILNLHFKDDEEDFEYYSENISESLGKHPTPIFEPLIIQLWNDYKVISVNSFQYLAETNPSVASQIAQSILKNCNDDEYGKNEELINPSLDFLVKKERNKAIKLIAFNLKESKYVRIEVFSPYIYLLKDKKLIKPLLYFIEHHKYNIRLAIRLLIDNYDTEPLEDKIVTAIKRNKNLPEYDEIEWTLKYLNKLIQRKNLK